MLSTRHSQDEAVEIKVQSAAGSTWNAEKADHGRYGKGETMELYLKSLKSRLV